MAHFATFCPLLNKGQDIHTVAKDKDGVNLESGLEDSDFDEETSKTESNEEVVDEILPTKEDWDQTFFVIY